MTGCIRRFVAGVLVVCMGSLGVPLPALAGIVSTEAALAQTGRSRLAAMLERDDVRAKLEALGVDGAQARARVAALSDEEAAQLASRMDALPAGGDLLGAALLVFLVLLFTDIMGYTKVFPFTRSMR